MVNFAELKAKAEKVKDASVTKVTNTRDRFSSMPSSKTRWDPNWKRAPPPPATTSSLRASTASPPLPLRPRPDVTTSTMGAMPPTISRGSQPADDLTAPPPCIPPPPARATSGYPPSHRESSPDVSNKIDWANLSPGDKEEFFGWLDEFFARYLGVELSSTKRTSTTLGSYGPPGSRAPPTINMATRPLM